MDASKPAPVAPTPDQALNARNDPPAAWMDEQRSECWYVESRVIWQAWHISVVVDPELCRSTARLTLKINSEEIELRHTVPWLLDKHSDTQRASALTQFMRAESIAKSTPSPRPHALQEKP